MEPLPKLMDMQQLYNARTNSMVVLLLKVLIELYESIQDGDRTTDTITYSPATEEDVMEVIVALRQLGFAVAEGVGTITVSGY
jgi:hypothetical protein